MSQEKVDKYKEYKKNRREIIEKEKKQQKRNSFLWRIVACLLALAVVAALGITVYNSIRHRQAAAPQYDREGLVVEDVAGIYATTTAAEVTTEATEGTTEAQATENDVETTTAAPETTATP